MRVRRRDLEVMFALSKYGVLSTGQIGARHFTNVERSTVLRRLRVLNKHGLILNPSSLENGMKVWSLSKAGAELIGAGEPFRHANRNTALHDVTLSSLRQHLEELFTAKNWVSDMQLRRQLAQTGDFDSTVPDGLFLQKYLKIQHESQLSSNCMQNLIRGTKKYFTTTSSIRMLHISFMWLNTLLF